VKKVPLGTNQMNFCGSIMPMSLVSSGFGSSLHEIQNQAKMIRNQKAYTRRERVVSLVPCAHKIMTSPIPRSLCFLLGLQTMGYAFRSWYSIAQRVAYLTNIRFPRSNVCLACYACRCWENWCSSPVFLSELMGTVRLVGRKVLYVRNYH